MINKDITGQITWLVLINFRWDRCYYLFLCEVHTKVAESISWFDGTQCHRLHMAVLLSSLWMMLTVFRMYSALSNGIFVFFKLSSDRLQRFLQ